jgi:hypothetical protein
MWLTFCKTNNLNLQRIQAFNTFLYVFLSCQTCINLIN